MIKTMLVEDERVILEDLLTIIDWQAEGFQIVATAYNGKQGLNKYEQFQPELIITDIRMPIMDGLSMLKSIRHTHPSVRFLILSAYNEFDYAKEAIRLGADDYILKTEISQEYLREKLNAIRTGMASQTDILYAAAEKKLLDFISNPQAASPEILSNILQPLESLPNAAAVNQVLSFLIPAIQKQYEEMMIPDKFHVPVPDSLSQIFSWLMNELAEISHLKKMIYHYQYSPIMVNAINYIKQNFQNPDLKINLIANHVGLSSGRFSVLFKKETGKTVNDFITAYRIEEAKKLLSSGTYKVYEVTELVGYKTSQYFSQIFFQYTGQYPNQYRRGLDL